MTAMNTAPKPVDHLKRNFLSILALGLGLVLGYGFGASRSNYAIVYAPAPNVPGVVDSAAQTAAPSLPAPVTAAQAQAASAVSLPASRSALAAPVRQEQTASAVSATPRAAASGNSPSLRPSEMALDAGAHEKTSAFIEKAKDVKPAAAVAKAAAPAPEVQKPVEPPPQRTIASGDGAIHYGAVSRGEIMGRGAGPVYNFSGGQAGAGGAAAGVGQASGNVGKNGTAVGAAGDTATTANSALDFTAQTLQNAPISAELRQRLSTSLKSTQGSVNAVVAGQPGQ